MNQKKIGSFIKELRQSHSLTQEELAQILGVNHRTVSRWETGKNMPDYDVIIDTPGEYAETKELAGSLAVYSAEADVVGLLISATEPFSLYPPNVTAQANREVVGIVTKCDHWAGNPEQAAEWLRLAGCKKIFMTSSFTGEGIADIISYLKEEHETLPWEDVKAQYDNLGYGEGESDKKMNINGVLI